MNCIELFERRVRDVPARAALWLPDADVVSFAELTTLAARAQKLLRRANVGPGDAVLVFDTLGPRLYAAILGALALGVTVVFVEPWMPVERVNHVVEAVKPKAFATGWLGKLWGLRASGVRAIPSWVSLGGVASESSDGGIQLESVTPDTPGIITFTSGTTGKPKGVVRTQGYLVEQHRVLAKNLHLEQFEGPDLCIFANFVLANLASGRTSVVIPPKWPAKVLARLGDMPAGLAPETMTAGPAFLLALMKQEKRPPLRSIHLGGALTDCWIHERALELWPDAQAIHVYGGSEAEPVAMADLGAAVRRSRARGLFQTLSIGAPVPEIEARLTPTGLWVAGPHVCPRYVGNDEENALFKRKDERGVVWHAMGDRIVEDAAGWWLRGRTAQRESDFGLEQRIYAKLETSKAFVHRTANEEVVLVGEGLSARAGEIKAAFPEVARTHDARIVRDRRHRARIDRALTLKRGAPWLAG